MKVASNTLVVESSGVQSEAFFNIQESNVAHIFGILRNQLYSNKELAIIREYCTNAFDAHVEAGIPDTPIQITFPTGFQNRLIIRDYGFGLSEENIYNVFASYGASTKRDTNEQVGMLGLGSKSAFCYTNDFTIVSYHKGIKSTYLAYIDETNIGKISKIDESPTTESGLAVEIEIKSYDVYTFKHQACQFLRDFSPVPNIVNDDNLLAEIKNKKQHSYIIDTPEYKLYWGYHLKNVIRMGNVNYEFNTSDLNISYNSDFRMFEHGRVYINAPIGSVVPSASRESLEFNAQTKQYIIGKLLEIKEKVTKDLQVELDACQSVYQYIIKRSESTFLIRVLTGTFSYKDNKGEYNEKQFRFKSVKGISVKKSVTLKDRYLSFTENQKMYVYVDKSMPQYSINLRIYQAGNITKDSFVLCFYTQDDLDFFVNHPDNFGMNFVNIIDLPFQKAIVKNTRQNVIKAEVHEFRRYGKLIVDSWRPTTKDLINDEGVYVAIKGYKPIIGEHIDGMPIELFNTLLNNLVSLNIDIPVINGVRAKDVSMLGHKWIELSDYIQQAIYNLPEEKVFDINKAYIFHHYTTEKIAPQISKDISKGVIFKDYTELTDIMERSKGYGDENLFNRCKKLIELGYKLDLNTFNQCSTLIFDMLEHYPVLNIVYGRYTTSCYGLSNQNKAIQALNDYIMGK